MEAKPSKRNFLTLNMYGLPLWAWLAGLAIHAFGTMKKSFPVNFVDSILLLFVVGFFFGKVGDSLPIWKDYLGGGSLLTSLGASFLVSQGIISKSAATGVSTLFDTDGMLHFFIAVIITSSILSIDKKFLAKAIGGFIPLVLVGTLCAFILAVIGGLIVGVPYKQVIMNYALPIMGGGNGAGAIPMSQIWGKVTHKDPKIWYSSAIAILTIGNVFAILMGALLNGIGKKMPKWTGNGELIKDQITQKTAEVIKVNTPTMEDAAFGLFTAIAFYGLGNVIGIGILPKIGSFSIHPYAYMVILLIIANSLDIIPERAKAGVKRVNEFMVGKLLYVFLAGVGITYTDFNELAHALTLQTVVISLFTVIGAVIGCWFFAKTVNFYEIEAAIAGGLCHVNRGGGAGDLEVLGASNRLILMSYAQLATRLGGAFILVCASFIFEMWAR